MREHEEEKCLRSRGRPLWNLGDAGRGGAHGLKCAQRLRLMRMADTQWQEAVEKILITQECCRRGRKSVYLGSQQGSKPLAFRGQNHPRDKYFLIEGPEKEVPRKQQTLSEITNHNLSTEKKRVSVRGVRTNTKKKKKEGQKTKTKKKKKRKKKNHKHQKKPVFIKNCSKRGG